ncbi:hypothetical protein Poli38472_004771 [Pythium oligandrum]|uniref:Uncharacterized protein n=1 Tax=Pythium oligandrum TaxID=41045 RepID=A0A8K1FHF9_PYTOL|nr:hypothetical protein Poli38472_004771 [Pythium oligandrum]|eukprot:TMW59702.1 hypothetical protein Poli38472_004771 [Pythium oligandrum]
MVTNCWLSPIIHLSARNFPAFRRFLYICADILLGCLLTVFVHMVIFISVIFVILVDSRNQTGGNTEYAFDVPYDDVFIMDVIKGVQQTLVLSWLDVFTKLLPFVSMAGIISQATSPSLHMLALIRANMTALPDAIQSTDFPCWLRNLTISSSNLTTLPSDIAVEWQYLFNLFIERTQIEMIAPTLAMSGAMRMSLMGNQTHEIPDDLLTHSRFSVLSVAINLITKWPATIGSLDDLTMLLMDYTEITELPSWLLEEGQHRGKAGTTVTVSAGGSAYCRAKKASSSFIVVDESNPGLKIVCREKREEEFEAYPLSYNIRTVRYDGNGPWSVRMLTSALDGIPLFRKV